MEDGKEVGTPIDAESAVRCMAASQSGKLIAAGTESAQVVVWDVETQQKVIAFTSKTGVNSVDISSDGTKIAIVTSRMVDVWSLTDNKWLWCRAGDPCMVKFSPDGCLSSLGESSSLSIYHSQSSKIYGRIPISARSVAWASDGKQLYCLLTATSTVSMRIP